MAIIGIYGFIGSGKGTVADILVENYGYRREAFANPVKDAVSIIFGWPRNLLEGDTKESRDFRETPCPTWSKLFQKEFSPRYALQLMGTEAGRNVFHSDLWLMALGNRLGVYGAQKPLGNVVISDVRFPNEIRYIRSLGGRLIRVKRGPEPDFYDLAYGINTVSESEETSLMADRFPHVHYSEWAWIGQDPDYLIENDSTLDDLKSQVQKIIHDMKG